MRPSTPILLTCDGYMSVMPVSGRADIAWRGQTLTFSICSLSKETSTAAWRRSGVLGFNGGPERAALCVDGPQSLGQCFGREERVAAADGTVNDELPHVDVPGF